MIPLSHGWRRLAVACALLATGAVGAEVLPTKEEAAELTYELRLQNIDRAKGRRALVQFLARELKENPRAYVKAWYANYLLYGAELGLKDLADPERGFALAQEAAADGSLFGLELVGRAWGDGRGTRSRDPVQAVQWLQRAVDRGRDTAMNELGKFYFFGSGVPRDRMKAEELIREGSRHGATQGLHLLAQWWENPAYAGTADPAKALALYYECALLGGSGARAELRRRADKGDRDAQKYLHLELLDDAILGADLVTTRLRKAVDWLGSNFPDDIPVQAALARVMIERELVVYNVTAAREKVARAVAAGSDEAREVLALMKWEGIGEKKDKAAAVALWRELAERNHPRSLARLGAAHYWGYAAGLGIEKDERKAFAYSKRAADLGDWYGQRNVGVAYLDGIGVEKNYYLAAEYFGRVAERGSPYSRKMRDRALAFVKD